MEDYQLLIDLHKYANRQGPGGDAETEKALSLSMIDPNAPLKIADIGCKITIGLCRTILNVPMIETATVKKQGNRGNGKKRNWAVCGISKLLQLRYVHRKIHCNLIHLTSGNREGWGNQDKFLTNRQTLLYYTKKNPSSVTFEAWFTSRSGTQRR